MKTPQEAAREYAETLWSRESILEWEVSRDACKTRSERDFLAGDAFGYRRGLEKAYRWISVEDELPDDDTLILTKDTDGHIDLIRGWQLKERIKPYAVQNFYTHWRPIEPVNK
ncbi:hypothetical protein [Barnesiella intestinihominis]|jgi:hypothetical protein|uniref:hypothetical protein n=1 Tax=Barnesiella intestinihominis TaxID=487174 RepID=UPI0039F48CBF